MDTLRKVFATLILGIAFALAQGASAPQARCAFCYSGPCYNSQICFRGCMCLKRGTDTKGECFSVDALPRGGELLQ